MTKKYSVILFFILFANFIFSFQKNDVEVKAPWKRHFFDLCIMGGPSFEYNGWPNSYGIMGSYGGLIGLSFGYQYAFTNHFAFGGGASGLISLIYQDFEMTFRGDIFKYHGLTLMFSGGALLFQFMFGDLKYKKIAFSLDVGGGWIGAIKLGLYYKGFVFKAGYHMSMVGGGHHVTFDFGYKFNWAGKDKNKKLLPESKKLTTADKISKIKKAKKGDVIKFSDIIFFADSDEIKQESFSIMDKIADALLERDDIIIEIGGYTNATGSPEEELRLSIDRAMKVAMYLVKKGVDANRIKASGYGAIKLKTATIDEANRRVEIKILQTGLRD